MIYLALFIIFALLEVLSAALVLVFRNILHIVLALSFLFIFNSVMFLMLGQPFLALIQLFIMVGGISTYIFVGVGSTSYSKFKNVNKVAFVIAYLAIFALFVYKLYGIGVSSKGENIVSGAMISGSLSSGIGLLYMFAVMLFGVGFGSILLMKRLGEKQ